MKKLATLIAVGAAVSVLAPQLRAGVAGTAHDLSGGGYGTTETCKFCHIPHNAKSPQLAPLWNHASTATSAFTTYTSATMDATPGQPAGVSKACLSCHDGTVAVDSYGTRTGTDQLGGGSGAYTNSTALVGIDLSDDHPISITYGQGTGLVTANGGKVDILPLYGTSTDQLECGSCHDPHDNTNIPFLRKSNSTSQLCTTCHSK